MSKKVRYPKQLRATAPTVEVTLYADGEDEWEIYVEGWYLCNVKRNDVSLEAAEVLGLYDKIKGGEL